MSRCNDTVAPACRQQSFVYFILASPSNMVKIGQSGDPETRLRQLQKSTQEQLSLIATIANPSQGTEGSLHRVFDDERLKPNETPPTSDGRTEWFRFSDRIQDFVHYVKNPSAESVGWFCNECVRICRTMFFLCVEEIGALASRQFHSTFDAVLQTDKLIENLEFAKSVHSKCTDIRSVPSPTVKQLIASLNMWHGARCRIVALFNNRCRLMGITGEAAKQEVERIRHHADSSNIFQ